MASFAVMLTTRPIGPGAILLMSDDQAEAEEIAGIMRSHGHLVDVRRVTGSSQGGGRVTVATQRSDAPGTEACASQT